MNRADVTINSTPLARFCVRNNIGLAALAELCGGTDRPTCAKILDGSIKPRIEIEIRKRLVKNLPVYLLNAGLNASQIDEQLLQIFKNGEYKPMISQKLELAPEVVNFFGLSRDPFDRPPNSRREVFLSPAMQRVVDRVIDAVRYQGFVSVTGEIGSGKSTVRALVEDYVATQPNIYIVWPEFFDMHRISPMQIAAAILDAFDTHVPQAAERRGRAVKQLLARLYQDGSRVAIAFDESHRLNDSALASLKNFLEMSSGGFQRYLGIVLFGQPHIEARLREYNFREIIERVVPVKMPKFGPSAAAYLEHRLSLVGGSTAELFDDEAVKLICRQSTTPLALGNITNEALTVSMSVFNNKRVLGAAIKTKMFFDNGKSQPGWTPRQVAGRAK